MAQINDRQTFPFSSGRTGGRIVPLCASLFLCAACSSGDTGSGNSSAPRTPPYVVQKGCEFTLQVSEYNSTSTTIEKGNTMVTLKLSMGDYQIDVSDCKVVDNPHALKIYQD